MPASSAEAVPAVTVDPVDFFADTHRFFEEAVVPAAGGTLDRFYRIHGRLVLLRFAGSALLRIPSAIEHWRAEPAADESPALTICLWDSVSTGTTMPAPPWGRLDYTTRGEIPGFDTERIRTAFQTGSDVLNTIDLERGVGLFWTRDARNLPQWEFGSPLRILLHWWLRGFGMQYVHAGAVGLSHAGGLLVGRGGSGKSTTCLACLDSPLSYVADDYCLLSANPEPTASNLYSTGKVIPDNLHRVPHLEGEHDPASEGEEKLMYFFDRTRFAPKLVERFPLKAVFAPRIKGEGETTLVRVRAAEALSALLPSTLAQLPGAGESAVSIVTRILLRTPCYRLELGPDARKAADVIANHLEKQ